MSIFKRISATLFSQVDQVVSDIENHDAVIEAAVRDNRRALAKAKARLNRLKADGRQLGHRLNELRQAETQWTQRAKNRAESDRDTALKCLQKRRDCQTQIARLEATLDDQSQAERRMESEINAMDVRIREVEQQRNLMRTRQSTAEAMRIFKSIEGNQHINIDDTFEKWEGRVMEAEFESGDLTSVDTLESSFLEEEMLDDLAAELDDLVQEDKS